MDDQAQPSSDSGSFVNEKGLNIPAMGGEQLQSESSSLSKSKPSTTPSPLPLLDNQTPSEGPKLSKSRRIMLGGVVMMTYALTTLTYSSTILIIPSMAKDLKTSELAVQWVTSAYPLANGCGLLVTGRLADLYGRKQLFLLGLFITCVFSIVSGVIRHRIALCVIRAIAGLGSAITMPSAFGIVGATFTEEPERTTAFAVVGIGFAFGAALGQVFGGLLACSGPHGWQYLFFLPAGWALVVMVIGVSVIPSEPPKKETDDRRVDWVGAGIITFGLSLFSFSITQGGLVEGGWKNAYIPVVFVLSVLLVVAFGLWEHYVAHHTTLPPIVHLAIFTRHHWKVTGVLLSGLSTYTSMTGWVYLTTIWYQDYKKESPIQNVLHVSAAPIVGLGVFAIVPFVAPRVRAPVLLLFGGFTSAAACWLFAVAPVGTTYWACEFLGNIACPFGADFTTSIGSILMSNLAHESEQSLFGALFMTAWQLSGPIGVCLCSLVQTVVTRNTGDLLQALRDAFWMSASFAWLSCLIIIVSLRKVGLAKDVAKVV